MKRVVWKEDRVVSVRVRPSLFTLAQMRSGSFMQFFDITSDDGVWAGTDLSEVPPLFCVLVAIRPLRSLFVETISQDAAKPNQRAMPLRLITYRLGSHGKYEADLVELNVDHRDPRLAFSPIDATVIKANLTIQDDLETIYAHELSGMLGEPERLRSRLETYFDTGVNWDVSKAFLFNGIAPPPSKPTATRPEVQASAAPRCPRRTKAKAHPSEGRPALRKKLRPLFAQLETEIARLPMNAADVQKLEPFKRCIEAVNAFAAEIETVEREAILEGIYELGATIGLDADTQFAEEWRGDW